MSTFTGYAEREYARVGPALAAVDDLLRIADAAGDRALTRSQTDDWHAATRSLHGELLAIAPSTPYIQRLAGTDPIAPDELRGIRAWLRHRLDQLERAEAATNLPAEARTIIATAAALTMERSTMHDPIRAQIEARELVHDYPLEEVRFVATDTAQLSTDDFAGRVAVYERTMSPWLALSEVVTGTGRDLVYPKLTADPTTYTPGQGTAITASDPTLSDITVATIAYKAYGKISMETVEDAQVNISDVIARSAARSVALAFGSAATTAILTGITNGGTATGTPFFTFNDVLDVQYGRPAPVRANGAFVLSNGAIVKARKWVDTTGQYLWQSIGAGQPDNLSGAPVYEDPYLAAVGSATKSVIFGDPQAALVVKMSPVRVAFSTDFAFNEDVLSWKVVHRIGIGVKDPTALAYLVSGNS